METKYLLLIGIAAVVLVVVGTGVLSPQPTVLLTKDTTIESVISSTGDADAVMTIPASDITSTASFYEYEFDGKTLRFFAVRASDGSIRTAFDACDVCYNTKKGYRQDGDVMVCNNCGNRYPIDGLGTENKRGGGCWPGYLPSTVEGDSLIIMESDLQTRGAKFL